MARQPCIECKSRPPFGNKRRCVTCSLRHEPIDVQVAAARARLAMVPEPLRRARVAPYLRPPGQSFCAGCQSFRDLADFGKGATQCRICVGIKAHAARTEKVYGLTPEGYADLLALQGEACAICRQRPGKKRLAVDHDHGTGVVRGLLCGRCNHELLGAGFDSAAKLSAAAHYLTRPPTTGDWWAPEDGLVTTFERPNATRPPERDYGLAGPGGRPTVPDAVTPPPGPAPSALMVLPVGARRDADGTTWKLYVGPDDPPPF